MTENGHSYRPTVMLVIALMSCVSCRLRAFDDISVCFLPASDRVVVEVRAACAFDHKGATLSCEVEFEGDDLLRVTTSGHDGRDPNDACAGALTATCESEVLGAGQYTVHFGDEMHDVLVPNMDDSLCEPEI